ncbi:MAG: hypothetical protein JWR61_269 [Ferruginibacter sp.]|nr:hypothetical protein [Ferruginibacter sp.]
MYGKYCWMDFGNTFTISLQQKRTAYFCISIYDYNEIYQ